MYELFFFFNEKNKCPPFTFTPRIEENVGVCFWVSAGADYSVGGPDGNVHAEFSHNALGRRLDRQPDRPVLSRDNFGPPLSPLQFRNDRNWDVCSLVLLRVATLRREKR